MHNDSHSIAECRFTRSTGSMFLLTGVICAGLGLSSLVYAEVQGSVLPSDLKPMVIGVMQRDAVSSYWLTAEGSDYQEVAKLTASDADTETRFGLSVALSASGRTALVGARGGACAPGRNCGAAYVFQRVGGVWIEQQKLTASDALAEDFFGVSVALSSDGNTALVGASAFFADCDIRPRCGAAYVFEREKGVWVEKQKLTPSNAGKFERFGSSVALSAHGRTILVGAPNAICGGDDLPPPCGAAYVFQRKGQVWIEKAKLTPAFPDVFVIGLGFSAALSSAGTTALVGTLGRAAYVFQHHPGEIWTEQQKLTASDATEPDYFGRSVALSARGTTALVGATEAAYVFQRHRGVWTEQQRLTPSDAASIGFFDVSVALSATGGIAFVGASKGGNCIVVGSCAAYVFERGDGVWVEKQKLIASDAAQDKSFGDSVALSAMGKTALVGGAFDECSTPPFACTGAAYVFSKIGTEGR